jgi:hypothetical protein
LFTNVYTGEKIQIFLFLSSFSNRALLSDATVLINEILNIIPTIFIDNYNKVQYDLMNYINNETSLYIEEILNNMQIINLVQNEKVLAVENNTDNEKKLTPKILLKEAFDVIKKVIFFINNKLLIIVVK